MASRRITKKRFDELVKIANEHGFDIDCNSRREDKAPYSDEPVEFICNKCGEYVKRTLSGRNLSKWIQELKCPSGDHCQYEADDFRVLTASGTMVWCEDVLGTLKVLYSNVRIPINAQNSDEIGQEEITSDEGIQKERIRISLRKALQQDIQKIYFSYLNNTIHLLFQTGDEDSHPHYFYGKYNNLSNIDLYQVWWQHDVELLELIKAQISSQNECLRASEVYDQYIRISEAFINKVTARNEADDCWVFIKLMYAYRHGRPQTDKKLEQYLHLHRCPVCGRYYTSKAMKCSQCGFEGVNKMFISRADADDWQRNILYPCQAKYWGDAMKISGSTLELFEGCIEPRHEFSVQIPHGITCIAEHAFSCSTNLYEVVFPSTVRVIQYGAFSCVDLMLISLPKGLLEIGAYSFAWCDHLMDVVIPDTVGIIGAIAFYGCSHLGDIFCETEAKPEGWDEHWNLLGQNDDNEDVYAQIHWGGTWHYENGIPVPNAL